MRMLLALMTLAGQVGLAAPARVSLPSQSAAPGSSVFLPLVFASQGETISGIQFDVQYDSSAMGLAAIVSDAARNSNKRVHVADLTPEKKRFLLVGLNQSPIPDGTLLGLFVNLNANAGNSVYKLTLSNVIGTNASGEVSAFASVDGILTVQGTGDQISRLQPAGVLNAASLLAGPVAPGEVVTFIGSGIGPDSAEQPLSGPSSLVLAGTSVEFDGVAAPLLYAGPNQINAVVPYGVARDGTTRVQVRKDGQALGALLLPVAAAAPAIFTLDSTGAGAGAILNQDSTVNSPDNPAARGSVATIFATGAGQTTPLGIDGQATGDIWPQPVLPVSVRIGGIEAEILYAGGAPTLVAGVLQVNCRIPPAVTPGNDVPIVLKVGDASSPAGVTVAVR